MGKIGKGQRKAKIVGLRGEVFESDGGKVAIAIPPLGKADSIPFEVVDLHQETEEFPAWADMLIGKAKRRVRINPDILRPPYHRLADCIALAMLQWYEIPASGFRDNGHWYKVTFPPPPHPEQEDFMFKRVKTTAMEVMMIDTRSRMES